MSDDESLYRAPEELEDEARRDPIRKLEARLIASGHLTSDEVKKIHTEVDAEIDQAAELALAVPHAAGETAMDYVYSPDVDPTSKHFDTEGDLLASGQEGTMAELINQCLADEMEHDSNLIVMGHDVADASRNSCLDQVKGKGGVFKVTAGLQRKFGDTRVFNTPLAEANIIGRSVGMALRGFKPVPEIRFFDYIWTAYMQLRSEVPLMRWRSNNAWKCPMVVRVPIGGHVRGGAIYHSQSGVPLFTHIPGWRVVMPSNALDACGLLRTAIRCDDPVLFLEHKHLYRHRYNRSQYPGSDFMIPFGKARIAKEGTAATVITYGALVHKSLLAARQFAERGIELEIIDLRSLNPYDWGAIQASVQKTNRVLVAYEDFISWGYGAEIAARIASDLFDHLDAPVRRVAAKDCFVSYTPEVEERTLAELDDLVRELEMLLSF